MVKAASMTITAKESLLEMGEFTINCATAGQGKHLILLHGGDTRESWMTWESFLPLANWYSLIMPDLIGFGKSSRPNETPAYTVQARIVAEMMDRLSVPTGVLVGSTWGGQVALQFAIDQPERVEGIVLISSTYDKSQLPRLRKVRRPTLILWAEDNMVAQLKAGYLLRDAIGTTRLEVLEPVAKDPAQDFTIAHHLERYKSEVLIQKIRNFLDAPQNVVREPPEMEPELRGMALKAEKKEDDER
ncbi:MAG: alpha/beta fold hydrolase [Thaumarchaeota archaeon]|nr:alpha/beta fold hydrolase [Nitrososphaerota archaeon]